MLGKTLAALTAVIVLAVAASIAVIAAALSLFWVLQPLVGQAGAAAILSGLFALIVAICVVAASAKGHHSHHHDHDGGGIADFAFVDRLIDMAKERPLLSIAAALAAGLIVVRNPALIATIVAAFMERTRPRD